MASNSAAAATEASSSAAAAASSSRINQLKNYGVFINYRVPDTGSHFVSHLHPYLDGVGVRTFLDSENFEKGDRFDDLLAVIKDSNIALLIFSENYGSSQWCWDELVEIMECEKNQELEVIPVFYKVETKDVGLEGSFGEQMNAIKLDERQEARRSLWKAALKGAPDRCGFDHGIKSKSFRNDHELVLAITNTVLQKIGRLCPDYSTPDGMPFRIQKFEELLCISSQETRIIGIQGMGGIGKTNLAESVFKKYHSRFHGCCKLSNVREQWQKRGVDALKSQLLDQVFLERRFGITDEAISNQLRNMRVLIVLDDVDDYMQFEHLIGRHDNLGKGSKVIVTSRDMDLLKKITKYIYEVPGMIDEEARQLFDEFFLKGKPPSGHHASLSERVLVYARGNPLALKVLGLLFHDLDEKYWEGAFKSLRKTLNKGIDEVLKVSFDALTPDQQEIFLHIACFLKGELEIHINLILESCGFDMYDLEVLARKRALIVRTSTRIEMHDLIQEMGRKIVLHEKEPGDRSRLWSHDDIHRVFTENSGSGAVKGIFLNMSEISGWDLSTSTFAKMHGIQLLKFYNLNYDGYADYPRGLEYTSPALQLPEDELESLPRELRYLYWGSYPLKSLPSLSPKSVAGKEQVQQWNLVVIDMPGSKVVRLWTEPQRLPNLKVIKLRRCRQLTEMPDFSNAPKLEIIDFGDCEKLQNLCPSISRLFNLVELILDNCVAIKSVPSTAGLKSLAKLSLLRCSKLSEFPEVSPNVETLGLAGTKIEAVPTAIGSLDRLQFLFLHGCKGLKSLPNEFAKLGSLRNLTLGPCIKEECLNILGSLSSLRLLSLGESDFIVLPPIINQLSRLQSLDLICCRELKSLEQLPAKLTIIIASGCNKLHEVSFSAFKHEEDWDAPICRLVFMNSPNLARDAPTNILERAKQTIKVMAPAVLKLPQSSFRRDEVTVVYPGNQIPEWFGNAMNGSSVSIELPPEWPNDNFLGFSLSIVLDQDTENTKKNFHDLIVTWKCQFEANGGESRESYLSFHQWPTKYLFGGHVFVFYSTRFHRGICEEAKNCPIGSWKRASFKAIIGDFCPSEAPCFTVKECAVYPFYAGGDDSGNRMHEVEDLSGAAAADDLSAPLSLSGDTIHQAGSGRTMVSMEGTQNMSGPMATRNRQQTSAVQLAKTQFAPTPVAPIPAISAPSAGTAPAPALSTVTRRPADFHCMGPSGDMIVGSIPSTTNLQAYISSDAVAAEARQSYSQLEGRLRESEELLQRANDRYALLEERYRLEVEDLRRQLAEAQNSHPCEGDEEGDDEEEGDSTGPPDQ